MKKILKYLKQNIIGFVVGGIVFGSFGVCAAVVISASNVGYSDTNDLGADNVQTAIDKLNTKATTKIVEAAKECPDGYNCIIEPSLFSTDSWTTIANAVRLKSYPYKVGDTKEVDMGEFGIHTVRIANTSPCTNGETSQTACGFVVEFADIITKHNMNSTNTNMGGWPASEMRNYVNGDIYNALPNDLQNVIAETTVVSGHGSTSGETNFTSSDKLYLLSTKEVYGKGGVSNVISSDTVDTETKQLDYYKSIGVTTSNCGGAIKQYNSSNYYWWLRSSYSNYPHAFFAMNFSGSWGITYASITYGSSPAFRII